MKIKNIYLKDHPFFSTIEIDCTNPEENPLDTVVFAGINGSGKTTLLYSIKELFRKKVNQPNILEKSDNIDIALTSFENEVIEKFKNKIDNGLGTDIPDLFNQYAENLNKDETKEHHISQLPKLVFLPSGTNFEQIKITNKPYTYHYQFFNQVDEKIATFIPDYFATLIDKKVYENEELPPKESIKSACDEINGIFEALDLESRLIGLKKDGSRMSIFKNKVGKEFDIRGLSSGEKQLFFRIMALKMFETNNSIILIDEPETSLHPAWHQKILKVYENIGENNQVIVATHSPHIIASTPKENVKILSRKEENGAFQILDYNDIDITKGAPVERILKDLMGLYTTRDPEIQKEIDQLWELIHQGKFKTDEFRIKYEEIEDLLGTIDEDMMLMKMEIAKKKWEADHSVKNE